VNSKEFAEYSKNTEYSKYTILYFSLLLF